MAEQSLYHLLGFHGSCTIRFRNGTIGVSSLVARASTGSTWTRTSVWKAFCMVTNRGKAASHLKNGCRAAEEELPQAKKRLTGACSRHLAREKRVLGAAEAVFLMSADRNAATEPRKTGLSTIRERNFGERIIAPEWRLVPASRTQSVHHRG